jgi:tuftelin-interacting protein 11
VSAPAFVKGDTVGGDQPPAAPRPFARRDDDDDERPSHGGLGLGASTGGLGSSGLGFTSGSVQTVRAPVSTLSWPWQLLTPCLPVQGAEPMEEDTPAGGLPTAFGQRVRDAAERRRQEADAKARGDGGGGAAGHRKGGSKVQDANASGAAFEAHTRGIGSKLLEKMGYKAGQGLGRHGTGIAEALQTKLRPKNMGMGFNDYQEQVKAKQEKEEEEEALRRGAAQGDAGAPAAAAAAATAPKGEWKRGGRATERRQKRVYKTAEELLRERSAADTERLAAAPQAAAPVTVIDMRGARAVVVTNLERLSQAPAAGADVAAAHLIDATPMPELQHNLRLVVDLTEAEIQSADRRLRQARDTKSILLREVVRLESEAQAHAARVAASQAVLAAVTQAASFAEEQPGAEASQAVAARFRGVQGEHSEEWALYGLANVALAHALPRLTAVLAGWRPLESPTHGVADLLTWRPVLERPGVGDSIFTSVTQSDDPYARLFADTAMPCVRSALTNEWDPVGGCDAGLSLFDTFASAMPPGARESLLHACVLPKLQTAVDAWDPVTAVQPIHGWLFPWLPHLGDALAVLYGPIRHKLATALGAWHPSDGSALAVLAPWRTVFPPAQWDALLQRCITPKLTWALSQLVINPADQQLGPLTWVLAWAGVVPARLLASLLDAHFFPPWHAVLRAWLASPEPSFDDITAWYTGWKALFPEEVLAQEKVRTGFTAALDLMNMAISGQLEPGAGGMHPAAAAAAAPPSSPPEAPYVDDQRLGYSLRDLVERFAEECDVPFVPKPGRSHAGMQVYAFGKLSVVVDTAREALLVQQGDADRRAWKPASIEQLLELHNAAAGGRT